MLDFSHFLHLSAASHVILELLRAMAVLHAPIVPRAPFLLILPVLALLVLQVLILHLNSHICVILVSLALSLLSQVLQSALVAKLELTVLQKPPLASVVMLDSVLQLMVLLFVCPVLLAPSPPMAVPLVLLVKLEPIPKVQVKSASHVQLGILPQRLHIHVQLVLLVLSLLQLVLPLVRFVHLVLPPLPLLLLIPQFVFNAKSCRWRFKVLFRPLVEL